MGFTQLEFLGLIGIASVFYFARRSFSDALSHMRGKDIKAMELYPALYKLPFLVWDAIEVIVDVLSIFAIWFFWKDSFGVEFFDVTMWLILAYSIVNHAWIPLLQKGYTVAAIIDLFITFGLGGAIFGLFIADDAGLSAGLIAAPVIFALIVLILVVYVANANASGKAYAVLPAGAPYSSSKAAKKASRSRSHKGASFV